MAKVVVTLSYDATQDAMVAQRFSPWRARVILGGFEGVCRSRGWEQYVSPTFHEHRLPAQIFVVADPESAGDVPRTAVLYFGGFRRGFPVPNSASCAAAYVQSVETWARERGYETVKRTDPKTGKVGYSLRKANPSTSA